MDSSDYSSSESEVEYEPIMVEDTEGKKILMKEESNPLAPVVIVNTKAAEKSIKMKKTKVFATKDTMLSLIESVNTLQDTKIQEKLDRNASYLQRLNNIEKATQERKSMKNERLNKIKENLRKGGVRVKGENKRIVREKHFKELEEKKNQRGNHNKKHTGNNNNNKSSMNKKKSSGPKGGSGPAKVQKKVKFAV